MCKAVFYWINYHIKGDVLAGGWFTAFGWLTTMVGTKKKTKQWPYRNTSAVQQPETGFSKDIAFLDKMHISATEF